VTASRETTMAPPLLGRQQETMVLASLLDALRAGRGGAVVVEGPAGIGKSRLLAEAARMAHEAGMLVAAGRADEIEALVPLAPLLSALAAGPSPILGREELRALERPGCRGLATGDAEELVGAAEKFRRSPRVIARPGIRLRRRRPGPHYPSTRPEWPEVSQRGPRVVPRRRCAAGRGTRAPPPPARRDPPFGAAGCSLRAAQAGLGGREQRRAAPVNP
jgi:AAA ATPase domain